MSETVTHLLLPLAGRATRLMPLTKALNKALLPVYDKPVLQWALDEAHHTSIEEFIFVLSPEDEAIADYLKEEQELNAKLAKQTTPLARDALALFALNEKIRCARHEVIQKNPQGLGDAVAQGWKACPKDVLAVSLSDDLMIHENKSPLKAMIQAHHEKEGAIILACEQVAKEQLSSYGIIEPQQNNGSLIEIKSLIEKPRVQDAPSRWGIIGRYILNGAVRSSLDKIGAGSGGEIQLTDAINHALAQGAKGYALNGLGRRYDCGSIEGLWQAGCAIRTQKRQDKK